MNARALNANPSKQSRAEMLVVVFVCLLLSAACGPTSGAARKADPEAARPMTAEIADADSDGFPDALELRAASDRAAFRRWFATIAELQFYRVNERWNAEQRDCAGLVRFALREALRRHDRIWFQAMGEGYEAVAPDVRGGALSQGLLGDKLFRTEFGAFAANDLEQGKFSDFADARTLKNYNAEFVSRNVRAALPGDLLFYHQPQAHRFPYHVMIFLGAPRHDAEGADDWVVYHTGASPADGGEVKKVRLAVLAQHPDPRWRPVASNANFIGFYRLKILQ